MSSISPELRKQLLENEWYFTLSVDQFIIYKNDENSKKPSIIKEIAIKALSDESKADIKTILKQKLPTEEHLSKWVLQKTFEPEYSSRFALSFKLLQAIHALRSNKQIFSIDFRNLQLTSLPPFLPELIKLLVYKNLGKLKIQNVKVRVFIEGNYFGNEAKAIIDRIENLENKEEIKKEITRQQEIASNPSLFLDKLQTWKKNA